MKYLLLGLGFFALCTLAAQDDQIVAVRDSICVMAGETLVFNVTENDQLPPGIGAFVFLLDQSTCFQLDTEGNLTFIPGAGDCCGEYTLRYLYENCGQPSICSAEIVIVVKCPKPDCSIVDLEDYLSTGEDPTGGNPMGTHCVNACENSMATYFLPFDSDHTYSWIVSGGSYTAGTHPAEIVVNWGAAGVGSLILSVTNASNETTIFNICVDILPGPTADFQKSTDTVCLNSPVYFTNTSLNGNSWFWDFGDGNFSNAFSPTHSYSTPGTYPVVLTVTKDNYGAGGEPLCCCTDTVMMDIVVDPLAGPGIFWISTLCAGDSTKYWTDATGCSSYSWTVLDHNDLPLPFTGQGNDTICVQWGDGPFGQIMLDVAGCDSVYCSQPVTAIVPIISPMATIAGLTAVCENEVATYTVPKWVSVAYDWQVSGGTILSGEGTNVIVVQWGTAPGPGTITLQYASEFLAGLPGHDEDDCRGEANLSVAITPAFTVTGPSLACENTSSFFAATATPSAAYTWSITPAVSFTGQGSNAINAQWDAGPGTFVVTATPDDPAAYCNNSVTMVVQVVALPKPSGVTGPLEICPGEMATYFGQTSTSGTGFSWTVTGGTPTFGTGNPLTVSWNNSGPYSLVLQQFSLTDPFCTSDTINRTINPKLLDGPLVITGPDGCVNATQSYSAGPVQLPEATYLWTVSPASAGSIVGGQGTPNPMVQWNNTPGTANLQLTVSLCGNSLSGSLPVLLDDVPPPTITQTGVLCPGTSVVLDAGAGYSGYNWSTAESSQMITVTSPGYYQVTVTNAGGCSVAGTFQVVELDGPVASISTPDPTLLCANPPNNSGTVTITALTGVGYSYAWYCNGVLQPLPGSQNFLVHTNTQTPATFNYWVEVTDTNGCTNTSNTITVIQSDCGGGPGGCNPLPYSLSFTAANQFPNCNTVDFMASISAGGTLLAWNFGDPNSNVNTGSLMNASHNYSVAGCYLVSLTAQVPSSMPGVNCIVEETGSVCVPLVADFSAVVNCLNVSFCDLSTYLPGDQPVSWLWNFGDGNTSTAAKPSHSYLAGNVYTVSLLVTNAAGCTATHTETITVAGLPMPVISSNPSPACVGTPIDFMATGSNIISWLWNFDDGAMNGGQNPSHTYLTANTYNVSLSVTDDQGCSNTVNLALQVFPNPPQDTIAWSPSLTVCAGNTVTLTAPSGTAYTYLWSTGATSSSIVVGASGSYGVTISDSNGCQMVPDEVSVVVLPLPLATIAGPDVICDEDCIELKAPIGLGYTYQWFGNGGTLLPGEIGGSLSVCDNTLQSPYAVQVTDQNGCTATSLPYVVTLATSPAFTLNVVPDSCAGTLSTITLAPVQADVIYQWSTGGTGTSINVLAAGSYTAIGLDTLTGCSSSATAIIYPLPDLCLVPTGCYEACNPDTICAPAGLAAYQWNLDGLPIAGANDQCLIVDQSGTYSLTGTTDFGCSLTSDSLILNLINCGCDGLQVMAEPSPTDSCCWTLSYDNTIGLPLYGLQISTNDAHLDVASGSIHDSLMIVSSTPYSVSLVHPDGLPLATGTIADFMEFCFSEVQNTPQQLIIDWYDFDFAIACSDTLIFNCPVEPDCIYLQSDTVNCVGNELVYTMTVCNPVDAAYPIAYLDIVVSSPVGILLTPPNFDLSSNPILAGDCRTLTFNLSGPNLAGETFCYNLVGHSDNPLLVDTALCCSLDTMYCITLPDCDPCDNIGVEYVEEIAVDEGFCCYEVGLFNNYQANYFTGVRICMLSAGTEMSMNNPFGSGWTTTIYSPTVMEIMASPPQGTSIPLGLVTLPEICLETTQAPNQLVEIKWLQGDLVVCTDTLTLSCEPPCGYLVEEEITCNSTSPGGWLYSAALKNTSLYTMGEAHIVFTNPAGLNIYNTTLPLGALPPGGFFPFTIPIGAPAMSGDTVCYTMTLHELDDNELHTNCCNFQGCFILPDCGLSEDCLCDETFFDQVSLGIECIPGTGTNYSFSPIGNLTSCDELSWYVLNGSEQQEETSTGNEVVNFTLTLPGLYTVCMKVSRTAVDGTTCDEGLCKDFVVPGLLDAFDPDINPNPAFGEIIITLTNQESLAGDIELLDLLGRPVKVYSAPVGDTRFTLDISTVAAGVYWVKLRTEEKQCLKKLVIL